MLRTERQSQASLDGHCLLGWPWCQQAFLEDVVSFPIPGCQASHCASGWGVVWQQDATENNKISGKRGRSSWTWQLAPWKSLGSSSIIYPIPSFLRSWRNWDWCSRCSPKAHCWPVHIWLTSLACPRVPTSINLKLFENVAKAKQCPLWTKQIL